MKSTWLFLLLGSCAALVPAADIAWTGQVFRVTSEFPKYVTCDIEFRDASQARWPSFFYGRPGTTNGFIKLDAAQAQAAFVLGCDKRPQKNGDQTRRLLGELFPDPNSTNGVTIRVNAIEPVDPGNRSDKGALHTTLIGVLELAGRSVPLRAPATVRYHAGTGDGTTGDARNEALLIEAMWEVMAGDLGLKTLDATEQVVVRFRLTAYSAKAVAAAMMRRR